MSNGMLSAVAPFPYREAIGKPYRLAAATLAVAMCLLAGCRKSNSNLAQGYVEGEFVYVASPLAGELKSLHVQRGGQVKTGDPLFALDATAETAARGEAQQRVAQARANLEDVKKGRRPEELAAIEAQLKQAQASLALSEQEFKRQTELARSEATAVQDVDRAGAAYNQDRQRVAQAEADLQVARLGARSDQITAAENNVRAMEAALAGAVWNLSQKCQVASQAGEVFDTLYRQGEWVAAGRPVVALLPPANIKVRAFVPQTWLGAIHLGDPVVVTVDGAPEPFAGKVNFISPQAEYTPPVIYSRESRSKLVFMVEVVFDPAVAAKLHPGQPVDVRFGL
jgi:HlyD family secretion protein